MLVGAVTQEPTFVGWVAATAVVIFLVSAFLLLVVAGGGEAAFPIRSVEDDLVGAAVDESVPEFIPAQQSVAPDFSEAAQDYAAIMAPALQPVVEAVIQRAQLRIGERVLDAGTGTGVGAAAAFSPSRSVVGVDTAEDLLCHRPAQRVRCSFRRGRPCRPPVPPGLVPCGDLGPCPVPGRMIRSRAWRSGGA